MNRKLRKSKLFYYAKWAALLNAILIYPYIVLPLFNNAILTIITLIFNSVLPAIVVAGYIPLAQKYKLNKLDFTISLVIIVSIVSLATGLYRFGFGATVQPLILAIINAIRGLLFMLFYWTLMALKPTIPSIRLISLVGAFTEATLAVIILMRLKNIDTLLISILSYTLIAAIIFVYYKQFKLFTQLSK